eukprot:TRINITY_DN14883_c0_g1_i1.p1 TRINITY_DN14883_c0_g1~~TRINITY_DN14883_c0_g1_i1.p1  ORF type:complete len:428 (+),score=23.02 TRINITY_DN14883_c0_g1_i1:38-1321(+)
MAACFTRATRFVHLLLLSVPAAPQLDSVIYTNAPQMSETPQPWRATYQKLAHGRRLSLSTAQQQAIVDKHNTLRAGVRVPCTAADMETLVWDTALATASANYASQCVWQHDPANSAKGWGENLAMSWSSLGSQVTTGALTGFVQAWYDEVEDTEWTADGTGATSKNYSNPNTQCKSPNGSGACMIGHYTQVVWAKSNKVGCGAVVCDSGLSGKGGLYLVCKYTPAGNQAMSSGGATSAPWIVGASCAACAGSCSNGYLCNAGASPIRCKDTITTMNVDEVEYTDCASLIQGTKSLGTNYWCTRREPTSKTCQLTCAACTVPPKVGLNFCVSVTASPTTSPMTTNPTASTTASLAVSSSSPRHSLTPSATSSLTPSPTPSPTPNSTSSPIPGTTPSTNTNLTNIAEERVSHGWRPGASFLVMLCRFAL